MIIEQSILESLYSQFVGFIASHTGESFNSFEKSGYLNGEENYKYKVYEEARENLANKYWKSEDIGTGKIQQKVSSAIKARVNYRHEMVDNNLVNWRQKDIFSKKAISKSLEDLCFNFYKSNIKDNDAFGLFLNEGLSYQFTAYLFFIKNKDKFLPISQERFDQIFKQIGLAEFKTSGNGSWENYSEFCAIIKQVQTFLKTKDPKATLLDAHSFLWILGNQMLTHAHLPPAIINHVNEKADLTQVQVLDIPLPLTVTESVETLPAIEVDEKYADELPTESLDELFEGAKRTITVNAYERSKKARDVCIAYWQAICAVCGMDFEKVYGDIGKGFIHVHHLVKIADIGQEYAVDPIRDLIPVCPNCHAMLHKSEPPMTIEALKAKIRTNTAR